MNDWETVANEFAQAIDQNGPLGIDIVRRNKLKDLFNITGRPVLLYAAEMTNNQKISASQGDIAINLNDRDGFREALRGINGDSIDVIVHSPGGSPEATEAIVKLLRSRFKQIRFLVPSIAKSAATMLCMSGNEIILGEDAEIGPTDPQIIIGNNSNPAHAIIKQFDMAKSEIGKNNSVLPAWIPILQQYSPSLIKVCDNAIKLSTTLVRDWLATYMFANQKGSKKRASIISKYLSGDKHLSHARQIDVNQLKQKGVNIHYANEVSPGLADALQGVSYAVTQTFERTGSYKIFESHLGKGFYKSVQVMIVGQN